MANRKIDVSVVGECVDLRRALLRAASPVSAFNSNAGRTIRRGVLAAASALRVLKVAIVRTLRPSTSRVRVRHRVRRSRTSRGSPDREPDPEPSLTSVALDAAGA